VRRTLCAVLGVVVLLAVAPATAGERQDPPPLTVLNRHASFGAQLGTFYWCYRQDPYVVCKAIDTYPPPRSRRELPVRPGDKVVLSVHAPAENVWIQTYDQRSYPTHPQPAGPKRRVWTLRIPQGIGARQHLLINVEYGDGASDAQFGATIRRANPPVKG
jgi:hypothetical protein